jgi:hypothetical protein
MTKITQKIDMRSMPGVSPSWYNFAVCNTTFAAKNSIFSVENL